MSNSEYRVPPNERARYDMQKELLGTNVTVKLLHHDPDRVPASSPEKLQAQTKICIFWNPAKLQAEQGFPD